MKINRLFTTFYIYCNKTIKNMNIKLFGYNNCRYSLLKSRLVSQYFRFYPTDEIKNTALLRLTQLQENHTAYA